ncbi:MAG: hypothetical protein IKP22_02105 [Clostridia bacterium]|nr:hypothetical protein [Clostridia bacterium]
MDMDDKKRLVLGHRSCPRGLREMPAQLERIARNVPVEALIPPVTPFLEGTLETVLSLLGEFEDASVTVNDWGTLDRVSQWKKGRRARLVLGALLNGQDSDPMIRVFCAPQPDKCVWEGGNAVLLRWAPPPEELKRHWAEPSAFHLAGMLRDMGVDAVETGLQALELTEAAGLDVRRLDWGVMSVKPCRGDCAGCGGGEITRAGCRVFFDRNLLKWEYAAGADGKGEALLPAAPQGPGSMR